jgi:uncharacterized protein (TIGR01777 family)
VAVTGSHGLISRYLVPELTRLGHEVLPVLRSGGGDPGQAALQWDPAAGTIDAAAFEGVDAVVHLAGVGIAARRWNAAHKQAVLDSRTGPTALLARTLAGLDTPPSVLVSASAIGYYGDRDDELLTESSPSGSGFLAEVCRRWEAAAAPAADAGIRTVLLRTGIVQAADGGSLKAQLPLFRLGAGSRIGRGRQWVSWISIDDEVGAIVHALDTDAVTGPVNLVAPNPVTNAEYTTTLGSVLHRPAVLAAPTPAVKLALGPEMASELLLASQRVSPTVLESTGYRFRHAHLSEALAATLDRSRRP